MRSHNEYLKITESYLSDLSVMERTEILNEINNEISQKDLPDLPPPLNLVNKKRAEMGIYAFKYQEKKSFLSLFFKFIVIMTTLFFIFIGVVVWKFTPVFKVDEERNRVIILGGLIDIDGRAGKFKIGDNYKFTDSKYENELKASIDMSKFKDEAIIKFNSGSFKLKTSDSNSLKIKCKLDSSPTQETISQSDEIIELDFTSFDGSSCELEVPVDRKITLEGKNSTVSINNPEFNLYIELDNGNVDIQPSPEVTYNYLIDVKSGHKSDFGLINKNSMFDINVSVNNGSVILK